MTIPRPALLRPMWSVRALPRHRWAATFGVPALIVGLAAVLNFARLTDEGYGNLYYAAAVKSMLTSRHAFFFVSYDAAGFVTVDKPPFGLWIQTAFARVLGFHGLVLLLPQALAGTAAVGLLYLLVRRAFGSLAGACAALMLALTPISVAANRNNTMDSLLIATLLLAAWAITIATDTGSRRWLFIGAMLVGIGFNIKMLQAYLVVPGLGALYLFGAPGQWWRRILHLLAATAVMLAVSAAWVVAVERTPPDQRPYIGSSRNNTVWDLIIGHNGLNRLRPGGPRRPAGPPPGAGFVPAGPNIPQGANPVLGVAASPTGPAPVQVDPNVTGRSPAAGGNVRPGVPGPPAGPAPVHVDPNATGRPQIAGPGSGPNGPPPPGVRPGGPPAGIAGGGPVPDAGSPAGPNPDGGAADGPPNGRGPGGPPGPGMQGEIGTPGVLRLFNQQLGGQIAWLLPPALIGGIAIAWQGRWRRRPTAPQRALILWAGWLVPQLVFFSVANLFHRYYLAMLAPAVAALAGAGLPLLWHDYRGHGRRGWLLPIALAGTGGVQAALLLPYPTYAGHLGPYLLAVTCGGAVVLLIARILRLGLGLELPVWGRWTLPSLALTGILMLLVAPFIWAAYPIHAGGHPGLPYAGPDPERADFPARPPRVRDVRPGTNALITYLQANQGSARFLLATPSSMAASPIIIATGEAVMAIGGFGGNDPILTATDFQRYVVDGAVRFVFLSAGQGQGQGQEALRWAALRCAPVPPVLWRDPAVLANPLLPRVPGGPLRAALGAGGGVGGPPVPAARARALGTAGPNPVPGAAPGGPPPAGGGIGQGQLLDCAGAAQTGSPANRAE